MTADSPSPVPGRLSLTAQRLRPNAIRAMAPLLSRPGLVSFAGGVPSAATFPTDAIARIAARLIREEGPRVLQYGTTRGNRDFAGLVIERLRAKGISWAAPENVLLTSGSQQGLDLLARVLVDPGDVVFCELPSYIGGLSSLWAAGADLVGIRLTDRGPDIAELERKVLDARAAGRTARIVYTIPTFQNPEGVTLSLPRRERLVRVARERELLVLEDNPYGLLRFEGDPLPTLYELDRGEFVIYLGTFSKILSPGIRLGWSVAPGPVLQKMNIGKQAADLCSSSLTQHFAAAYFEHGRWRDYLGSLVDIYRARRDTMLAALHEHFPREAEWTRPEGGLFVWVTLPDYLDTTDLLARALGEHVAFVPGRAAFMDGRGGSSLRLNFSGVNEDEIREGVRRIGKVLREQVDLYGTLTGRTPAAGPARDRAEGSPERGAGADVVPLPAPAPRQHRRSGEERPRAAGPRGRGNRCRRGLRRPPARR